MGKKINTFFLLVLSACVVSNLYLVFAYAPVEKTMGIVQKIFYSHVASAWVGFFAFVIVFMGSVNYLLTRNGRWDMVALASAEIGIVFTTIVLVTGPIWAKAVWNTYWTWDPRLTMTLILWLMYLAYVVLQGFDTHNENRAGFAATYGIIAFVNVPLVFFSIRWWRTIHPLVIGFKSTGLTSKMLFTMIFAVFTFSLLYFLLLELRYKIVKLSKEVKLIKEELWNIRRES